MAHDNGGGNSPPVVEIGDAPDLTRTISVKSDGSNPDNADWPIKKIIIASWSSLEVFASQFRGDQGAKWWARHNVRNDWSPHFNGCDSFDEALDMAIHGWAEGGETIERTRGYVRALNPLSPRMVKYGIAGSTPNVPRAIAGNLLNMRIPEPGKSRKKQIITIIYNMCENGGVDAEMITNKAAVTAALIDEIEAKGFAVEVISAVATNGYDYHTRGCIRAYEFVRIKESHHPIDINRIAFGLGHAAMFRGLFFADMQRNHEFKEIGEGLGSATSMNALKEHNEEQIYTISSAGKPISAGLFKDVDTAVTKGLNAIVRELQKQGCPAFPKLKDHEDGLDKEPREEDTPEFEDDF
jgi:hypothetical protein